MKSAEEQAAERYPNPEGISSWSPRDREHFITLRNPNRHGFATCLTERAFPAEQEVVEQARLLGMSAEREASHLAEINGLKKTMQVLVDALKDAKESLYESSVPIEWDCRRTLHAALSLASEKHGIKPSIQ